MNIYSLYQFCSHDMIIYFIAPAGLGIFTGIDLQPEEAVAEPDIVIPFHDVSINLVLFLVLCLCIILCSQILVSNYGMPVRIWISGIYGMNIHGNQAKLVWIMTFWKVRH